MADCFRGSGEITPSDRTDLNPLNGVFYRGPGFKSRRPDELKGVSGLGLTFRLRCKEGFRGEDTGLAENRAVTPLLGGNYP